MSATPAQITANETMSDVPYAPSDEDMDSPEPHGTSPEPPSEPKQRLLAEQVSFIIRTRDNNTPDPYGKQSRAYGPLPWPAVADAYNQAFRAGQPPLGWSAMEKRARHHRAAWMAARPDYPRRIGYSVKPTVPVAKRSRVPMGTPVAPLAWPPREQPPQGQLSTSQAQAHELGAVKRAYEDLVGRAAMAFGQDSRASRVAGYVPPDEARNADLDVSRHGNEYVGDSEQHEGVVGEGEDDAMEISDAEDGNEVSEVSDTDDDEMDIDEDSDSE
jgi:hypothetical protein